MEGSGTLDGIAPRPEMGVALLTVASEMCIPAAGAGAPWVDGEATARETAGEAGGATDVLSA